MSDTFETIKTLREMEDLEEGAVWNGVKAAAGKVGQIGLNLLDAGINASKTYADSKVAKPAQQRATEEPAKEVQNPKPQQEKPQQQQQSAPQQTGAATQKAVSSLKALWKVSLSESNDYFEYFLREAGRASGTSEIAKNYRKEADLMKDFVTKPSTEKVEPLKKALLNLKNKAGPNAASLIDRVVADLDAAATELQSSGEAESPIEPQQELVSLSVQLAPKMLFLKQNGQSQFTKEDVPNLEKFVSAVRKSVGA